MSVPVHRRNGSASRERAIVAGLLILISAGCPDILGSPPSGPEGPGRGGLEDAVTALVNDHRQSFGCPRLVWNEAVASVARAHSHDMLERDYFGHYDPDGHGLGHRLREARIRYSDAAENIAQGFRYENAAAAVFAGWMQSQEHRRIIEKCDFLVHGIGFADYRWTHVFMR